MQTHKKNTIQIVLKILYWNDNSVTMAFQKWPPDGGLPYIQYMNRLVGPEENVWVLIGTVKTTNR